MPGLADAQILDLENDAANDILNLTIDANFPQAFRKVRHRYLRNVWDALEAKHPGVNVLVEILRDMSQIVDDHGHTELHAALMAVNMRAAFFDGATIVLKNNGPGKCSTIASFSGLLGMAIKASEMSRIAGYSAVGYEIARLLYAYLPADVVTKAKTIVLLVAQAEVRAKAS